MYTLNKLSNTLIKQPNTTTRCFWGWINHIFNRVDEQRMKQFGSDRACAEWLLRNGAAVKWVNSEDYLKDYNSLPIEGTKRYIKEVDATDSSIMHHGFPHFRGCKHIDKVILHKCNYLENEAMGELRYLKDTLKHLQVSSCGNITSVGLYALADLSNLKHLEIFDLQYVKDKEKVLETLRSGLTNCNVSFE